MQRVSLKPGVDVPAAIVAPSTTVGSAVATTASTTSTPYGYAQAQADAIVTNLNALRVDVLALRATQALIVAALTSVGVTL